MKAQGAAKAKKRWADLSAWERAGVIILATLQIGLLAAALWDIAHRSADEVRGDRRMWAALVFINWIGPLAYFTIGRKDGIRSLACCTSRSANRGTETEPSMV